MTGGISMSGPPALSDSSRNMIVKTRTHWNDYET